METEGKTIFIVFDGKRYMAYASQDLDPGSRLGINRFRHVLEDKLAKEGYTSFKYSTKTSLAREQQA